MSKYNIFGVQETAQLKKEGLLDREERGRRIF
jgi:hypothetical protein